MKNTNAHAYPIRLIDKIIQVEHGQSAQALKNVSFNEKIFSGHFPNNPIYPGVYTVEGLCQTAQLIVNYEMAVTAKLDKFKFIAPIEPGDQITYKVELQETIANFHMFKAQALVNDKVVVSGQIVGTAQPA